MKCEDVYNFLSKTRRKFAAFEKIVKKCKKVQKVQNVLKERKVQNCVTSAEIFENIGKHNENEGLRDRLDQQSSETWKRATIAKRPRWCEKVQKCEKCRI